MEKQSSALANYDLPCECEEQTGSAMRKKLKSKN